MGAVIMFLKSGLGRSLSIGAVFLLVLGSCAVQTARLKNAKGDLAEARAALYVPDAKGKPTRQTWKAKATLAEANLSTCRTSAANLEKSLTTQNAAVAALKAEGDRLASAAAQALQEGRKQGMAAQAEADRILGIKPAGADLCERLIDAERQITEGSR